MEISDLQEKLKHLNENYQSAMIYYHLFKQLNNTLIKDYGEEIAERNVKIRNFYGWILGKNTEIAFLNISIIQIFSIGNDHGEDKYSLLNLLNELFIVEMINKEEKKKMLKYITYIRSEEFRNIRHSLAHSFFREEKQLTPIDIKKLDDNIVGFGNILNEIDLKLNESSYYYDGFQEGISRDYKRMLEDLDFGYNIRSYYRKLTKENPDLYFIEECRKYCNLPI